MANFNSVLDKKASEVKKLPPVPIGHYVAIAGPVKYTQMGKDKTDAVEWESKLLMPQNDVDQTALQEIPQENRKVNSRFFLTEKAITRLWDFLVVLGKATYDPATRAYSAEGDKGLRQLIPEIPGCQYVVEVKHEPSEDMTQMYANVAKYLKP
jgi:hypothetical protein